MSTDLSSTSTGSIFSTTWNGDAENDVVAYRQFSIPAILALGFGLASFLVYLSLWFLFLGVLGILFALFAIGSIRRSEGLLSGAWAAQLALSLSLISLVSIGVFWPYYQYTVRLEADAFFRTWFQSLREHDIPTAFSLRSPFWERNPNPKDAQAWWDNLPEQKYLHRAVHDYVDNPVVKTLLELGEKADVSYFRTDSVRTTDGADHVAIIYAVTYPGEVSGGRETFFLRLAGKRQMHEKNKNAAGWSMEQLPNDVYREKKENL